MARAGMADLIAELRGLGNASTNDFEIAGVTYWTDDQLEAVLDGTRVDFVRVALAPETDYSGTTAVYTRYRIPYRWVELPASGTDAWKIEDGDGNVIDPATYSVNWRTQTVSFSTDQGGEVRTLTGRAFDLYRAAANVWRRKAAWAAPRFDIRERVDLELKRTQVYEHCLRQAAYFEALAGPISVQMVRGDEA